MKKAIKNSDKELLGRLFFDDPNSLWVEEFDNNSQALPPYFLSYCKKQYQRYSKRRYFYICNADGSIRWIYDETLTSPLFLLFYNAEFFKAKIFKVIFKLLFLFRLKTIANHGGFTLHYKSDYPLQKMLDKIPHNQYAIFTGTVGSTRKFVMATAINKRVNYFIKKAWLPEAIKAVENERKNIDLLQPYLKREMPSSVDLAISGSVAVESVKTNHNFGSMEFTFRHKEFLNKLYQVDRSNSTYNDWSNDHIVKRLESLHSAKTVNDIALSKTISESLESLHHQLYNSNFELQLTWSHQDFTPWNMYVGDQNLAVYDWELAQSEMPLFYDVFHFFFQKGILVQRKGYGEIREDISKAFNDFELDIQNGEKLDWKFYLKLYLLLIVPYYLKRYLEQPDLHIQAHWLIEVWAEALEDQKKD